MLKMRLIQFQDNTVRVNVGVLFEVNGKKEYRFLSYPHLRRALSKADPDFVKVLTVFFDDVKAGKEHVQTTFDVKSNNPKRIVCMAKERTFQDGTIERQFTKYVIDPLGI